FFLCVQADMEEAKTAENAKLRSALKELETQMADMDKAKTEENAKLQSALKEMEVELDTVSSLEQENSEIQKKFEETSKLSEDRLKEAMDAESKIIDLKLDMQSLQEKIADMEAEDQMLRQK
nr:myosin XI A [Tanacetum cinerariifolium]